MTTIVLSPFYPISDNLDVSHRAGWPRYWAEELLEQGADDVEILTTKDMGLLDNVNASDTLLVYHGMEFQGNLNLQSGLTDEIVRRAELLALAGRRATVVSMDIPMPDYGKILHARGLDAELAGKLTNLKRRSMRMETPHHASDTGHLVFGDSHSLSLYTPGSVIARHDGQTLFGALRRVLLTMVDGWLFENNVEMRKKARLTAYFGNIDLRHHLPRQPHGGAAIKELVTEYGKQLEAVAKANKLGAVEVVMPMPIEDEARPIPKNMWYQGQPFHGSWSERHHLRLALRDALKRMCRKRGFEIYDHPRHWIGRDGKLSFDVMEKPRSVHIRPAEYRLVQEGKAWRV